MRSEGPDAAALARRVESAWRSLHDAARGLRVELYHRASRTMRVGLEPGSGRLATRSGDDEGLAVRATDADGRLLGFASAAGSDLAAWHWALERSREHLGPASPGRETWAGGTDEALHDHDADPALPSAGWLADWLERARASLEPAYAERPQEMWIEAAVTVETWVADGGLRAGRTRSRGWALLRSAAADESDRPLQPVIVGMRHWSRLSPESWREVLDDRRVGASQAGSLPTRALPVVFNPACSARLVHALVRQLHGPGTPSGFAVGPAWRLADEPRDPEALFGGEFDDAGFTTRSRRLANGLGVVGRLGRRGQLRRGSYRDRPAPRPTHVVVAPRDAGTPQDCIVVTGLRPHVLGPDRWLLGLDGVRLRRGTPAFRLPPAFVADAPAAVVRRCVGTVGPPRRSHLGVETPALVFEDLQLQA